MNQFSSIIEHSVERSRGTLFSVMRIAAPILSVILSLLISNAVVGMHGLFVGVLSLIVLLLLSLLISGHYLRRVDYDYRIVEGEFFFSAVYNRRRRKELGSLLIAQLDRIAPYAGKYLDELEGESFDKVYDFSSSPDDPYVFFAVECDAESKKKTLYLFNATDKMLNAIRIYNRRAVTAYPNE